MSRKTRTGLLVNSDSRSEIIRRLRWGFGLTAVMFLIELGGGLWTNSLALLADAGHLLADAMALGLALLAAYLSCLPANHRKTYGYHRAEILAALANGIMLLGMGLAIVVEAIRRVQSPEKVKTTTMLLVAAAGLVVNLVILLLLRGSAESKSNLNIKAAFFHVAGDVLASVGVIVAGVMMSLTGNYLADPLVSLFVATLILVGGYRVAKEAIDILLEGVPKRVSYEELAKDILATTGVRGIHDLHVWSLSSATTMLSTHVSVDGTSPHAGREILRRLQRMLAEKHNIRHSTIQIECDCCQRESVDFCFAEEKNPDQQNP